MKKLQVCMKHYDYKDETKDVRGKVSPQNPRSYLSIFLLLFLTSLL